MSSVVAKRRVREMFNTCPFWDKGDFIQHWRKNPLWTRSSRPICGNNRVLAMLAIAWHRSIKYWSMDYDRRTILGSQQQHAWGFWREKCVLSRIQRLQRWRQRSRLNWTTLQQLQVGDSRKAENSWECYSISWTWNLPTMNAPGLKEDLSSYLGGILSEQEVHRLRFIWWTYH